MVISNRYCDRCGALISDAQYIEIEIKELTTVEEFELCPKCAKEIKKDIENYTKGKPIEKRGKGMPVNPNIPPKRKCWGKI